MGTLDLIACDMPNSMTYIGEEHPKNEDPKSIKLFSYVVVSTRELIKSRKRRDLENYNFKVKKKYDVVRNSHGGYIEIPRAIAVIHKGISVGTEK